MWWCACRRISRITNTAWRSSWAEERYRQSFDLLVRGAIDRDTQALSLGHSERVLRSDYALTRAADKDAWVGYRDTFEVDGKPLRDRTIACSG